MTALSLFEKLIGFIEFLEKRFFNKEKLMKKTLWGVPGCGWGWGYKGRSCDGTGIKVSRLHGLLK